MALMDVMDSQATKFPHVHPRAHDKYLRLIDAAQKLPPVVTAVAHPCDEVSLEGAVEARKLRLIEPILVGPPARIRDVAARSRHRHHRSADRRGGA